MQKAGRSSHISHDLDRGPLKKNGVEEGREKDGATCRQRALIASSKLD